MNAVIGYRYTGLLGPYWPPERRLVDEGYAPLPFPFDPLPEGRWRMTADWTWHELIGYLRTWSAVQRYEQAQGHDPVADLSQELKRAWGTSTSTRREVRWPVTLRVGRLG